MTFTTKEQKSADLVWYIAYWQVQPILTYSRAPAAAHAMLSELHKRPDARNLLADLAECLNLCSRMQSTTDSRDGRGMYDCAKTNIKAELLQAKSGEVIND